MPGAGPSSAIAGNALRGLLLMPMFLAGGCATVRDYPICLYDTELEAAAAAARSWPQLRLNLRSGLALHTRRPADAVIISSREAVAKATPSSHARIRRWWPSAACYGSTLGGESGQRLDICTNYVRARLATHGRQKSVATSVVKPACVTVEEGKASGSAIRPAESAHLTGPS